METIAKKVVQNWAAKGYISDDEVEMCLYNLIRHTFTVAVLCVLTVAGALLGEWGNTIVLILSILFLRTFTNGYHCKSCVACIFLSLAVTLLSLHIVPLLNFITALILMFVGSSIILAIAPTNSPQMHLTETEMTAMRKHVRIRLLILTVLLGASPYNGAAYTISGCKDQRVFVNMEKAYCIAVAVAVVAVSLLAVRCKSQ